jgi:hypothetical protein
VQAGCGEEKKRGQEETQLSGAFELRSITTPVTLSNKTQRRNARRLFQIEQPWKIENSGRRGNAKPAQAVE